MEKCLGSIFNLCRVLMTIWQVMIFVSEAIRNLSSSILPHSKSPRFGSTTDHALAETRGTNMEVIKDETNQ